jgi:hypothetical protein
VEIGIMQLIVVDVSCTDFCQDYTKETNKENFILGLL